MNAPRTLLFAILLPNIAMFAAEPVPVDIDRVMRVAAKKLAYLLEALLAYKAMESGGKPDKHQL